MQETIGLIVFLFITAFALYRAVYKKMNLKLTTTLLCFSIASGFSIANWDIITKFKWGQVEVETARRAIGEAKQSALNEIASEVKDQKESIKLLVSNANDSREKIEKQKQGLERLIKTATDLQGKIEEQKKITVSLNQSAQKTKSEIEKLNGASAQIALSLIRAFYFTMETKSEFGGPRSQKAMEEILNDLNRILPMVIPDPKERVEWVKKLQSTLSEKN